VRLTTGHRPCLAIVVAWDAFDGFRKAWLNTRPERVAAT
jgi:hypothetical protein